MSSGKTENSIKLIIDTLDSNKTFKYLELLIPKLNGVKAYHNAKKAEFINLEMIKYKL